MTYRSDSDIFDKYRPPGWSARAEWVEAVTKNDRVKNLFMVMWILNKKWMPVGLFFLQI